MTCGTGCSARCLAWRLLQLVEVLTRERHASTATTARLFNRLHCEELKCPDKFDPSVT
jgi:hypothetical protein